MQNNVVIFRVDANALIGSGHLMRCLTLANILKNQGADIHFISRNLSTAYQSMILQQKIVLHLLEDQSPPEPDNWLGVTWEEDAKATLEIVNILSLVALLVVDHYSLDDRWESCLQTKVKKILVIDDLANRPHVGDVLLDQNIYFDQERRYQSLVSKNTSCLIGPQFSLLRSEFNRARQLFPRLKRALLPVKRINICFGGVDANGDTLKVLQALTPWLAENNFQIDVILGAISPHTEAIKQWIKPHASIQLYFSPPHMAELLAKADLGIGAGGSMIWERACVGLPSIVMAVADNQKQPAENAACFGMHHFLGESAAISVEKLRTSIAFLLDNPFLRQNFADNCLRLVDGRGAKRVANQVFPPVIALRPAIAADCLDIFVWRNHPVNRQYSHNSQEILYEEHQVWFQKILQAKDRFLLIGSDKQGSLGVLRFDSHNDRCMVSVYLVPNRQGEGLGPALLKEGLEWLKLQYQKPVVVYAEIYTENIASHIAFLRAGFKKQFSTFIAEVTLS